MSVEITTLDQNSDTATALGAMAPLAEPGVAARIALLSGLAPSASAAAAKTITTVSL